MTVTAIRNAAWAVLWDGQAHHYARDVDVVFDESGILHAGPGWTGRADDEQDGRSRLVMPGLVNIH